MASFGDQLREDIRSLHTVSTCSLVLKAKNSLLEVTLDTLIDARKTLINVVNEKHAEFTYYLVQENSKIDCSGDRKYLKTREVIKCRYAEILTEEIKLLRRTLCSYESELKRMHLRAGKEKSTTSSQSYNDHDKENFDGSVPRRKRLYDESLPFLPDLDIPQHQTCDPEVMEKFLTSAQGLAFSKDQESVEFTSMEHPTIRFYIESFEENTKTNFHSSGLSENEHKILKIHSKSSSEQNVSLNYSTQNDQNISKLFDSLITDLGIGSVRTESKVKMSEDLVMINISEETSEESNTEKDDVQPQKHASHESQMTAEEKRKMFAQLKHVYIRGFRKPPRNAIIFIISRAL